MLISKIEKIIIQLNKASNEYYNGLKCSMSDMEWDNIFDELLKLEKETGIIMSNSPTQNAGYKVLDNLSKIKHSTPLLSLGKTKKIEDLKKFLGDKEGVLSLKMDGGTQCANYENKKLTYLATRGSSATNEGQDITHNSMSIIGIPKQVSENNIQVVGEGIMYNSKFKEINSFLSDEDKYANPRNLANATSSMLDSKRVAEREIRFVAFCTLETNLFKTKVEEFEYLKENGFNVVEYVLVTKDNIEKEVKRMTSLRENLDYDIDGLVLSYNDLAYGHSLGKTSHHFKHSIAYKFAEDEETTILRKIHIDIGKSGQVSYVAEFDSVELCGTQVSRATLNNHDFIKSLELGIGDEIVVMKRNEIIPYVSANNTRSNTYEKATICPVCGSKLENKGVHQFCTNYMCERQLIGRLTHFCSRDAMNIEGLSEETIKSIRQMKYSNDVSVLENFDDIYNLTLNKDSLYDIPRFGKKKVDNICKAIEKSKIMPLSNVLYALSIPQVGKTASKLLAEHYKSMINIIDNPLDDKTIKGLIGESTGQSFIDGMNSNGTLTIIKHLIELGLTMEENTDKGTKLDSKTFVITGSTKIYKNRKEIQSIIENLGGKVTGSVSKNTDYLINNDVESSSSKNKKAKSLNVPIINEEQFQKLI